MSNRRHNNPGKFARPNIENLVGENPVGDYRDHASLEAAKAVADMAILVDTNRTDANLELKKCKQIQ